MRVDVLKQSNLPSEFLACLPDKCPFCGGDLEITISLSQLSCANEKCVSKATRRLVALCKDLAILNMGESRCERMLNHFGVTSPYALFRYELVDGPLYPGCSMEFSESIFEQVEARREMYLSDYLRIGNLPGIQDNAVKLTQGYTDLESFYAAVETGGIAAVQKMLGIKGKKGSELSIRAVETYETLLSYKEELFESLPFVRLKVPKVEQLNIVISRSVGGEGDPSKAQYLRSLKEEFAELVHINVLSSVREDCDVLIWSGEGEATSKVEDVLRKNESRQAKLDAGEANVPELIPVMNGTQFKEYIRKLYKGVQGDDVDTTD